MTEPNPTTTTTIVFADCAVEVEMTPESIGPDGEWRENCRVIRWLTPEEADAIRAAFDEQRPDEIA